MKGNTKFSEVMALVGLFYFCAAHYNIYNLYSTYPYKIADAISNFQDGRLKELAPGAKVTLDNIPAWPAQAFTFASCSLLSWCH